MGTAEKSRGKKTPGTRNHQMTDLTITPLLVFGLKQYPIIKLYTNNRSEENNHITSVHYHPINRNEHISRLVIPAITLTQHSDKIPAMRFDTKIDGFLPRSLHD
jgi:hypothetical protein